MTIADEIKSMFITICFLGYVFIVSGLIVNFLQLCSCIIWPFSKELYRKINCYLALAIWSRKSSRCALCFILRIVLHRIHIFRPMVVEE